MIRAYYWLLVSAPVGELYGELFQAANDRHAADAAFADARAVLPNGVHRVAVSGIRGDGSSYVVAMRDVEVGQCACA